MKKNGFTIIEVGVVILLIGVISFGLSPFARKNHQIAYNLKCINNLQKISLALRAYALENNEKVPQELGLLLSKGYIDDEAVFDCPFSEHKGNAENTDYRYIGRFDFNAKKNIPIVFDKKAHSRDGLITSLSLNGEVTTEYIQTIFDKEF